MREMTIDQIFRNNSVSAQVKKFRSQVWPLGFVSESQNEILRVNKTYTFVLIIIDTILFD